MPRPFERRVATSGDSVNDRAVSASDLLRATITPAQQKHFQDQFVNWKHKWQLTRDVEECLKVSNVRDAIYLLRLAPKQFHITRAWNKVIDYVMRSGDLSGGMNIYEHMKSVGPGQDAHTLAIVLRGLAHRPVTEDRKKIALDILLHQVNTNPTWRKNARINNAAMMVFANTGDWSEMWKLFRTMTTAGVGAYNEATYDLMFRALRWQCSSQIDEDGTYKSSVIERCVALADNLWVEAAGNSRDGSIKVTEQLFNAYLLVLDTQFGDGKIKNAAGIKVLKLIEQVYALRDISSQVPSVQKRIESIKSGIYPEGSRNDDLGRLRRSSFVPNALEFLKFEAAILHQLTHGQAEEQPQDHLRPEAIEEMRDALFVRSAWLRGQGMSIPALESMGEKRPVDSTTGSGLVGTKHEISTVWSILPEFVAGLNSSDTVAKRDTPSVT
ncbi:Hypothetical protein D9617_6g094060 [Elsinoe fawcettii]|nr:Hypothetical protein D9617_6g094060 [Elsinoe fawcettii]